MKVLVLGATGFIGGNIAKEALNAGWFVRGLHRHPHNFGALQGSSIEWVLGDLRDQHSLEKAMRKMDIVFHAAAFYPKSGDPRNVIGQIIQATKEINTVLEAFKSSGSKRLIYTSSLSTIGHPLPGEDRLANEHDFYQFGSLPKSGYYECKSQMENIALEAANTGIDIIVLNPTAVFGPGDIHLSLGRLLIAVAKGYVKFWLPGDVNVIDVRDCAKAHITAAMHAKCGHRYILGGHNYTIKQALEIAANTLDVPPPLFKIPMFLVDLIVAIGDFFPFLPLPANHMRTLRFWQGYDTKKAENDLKLIARPFSVTVTDSINWFKEIGFC